MNISIFWARLQGLYTVIICIGMLFNLKSYQAMMLGITRNPSESMTMGFFAVFLGLAVVVSHNIWKGWPIIITLMGYWLTIKGIILSFFPLRLNPMMEFWSNHSYIALLPAFVIGLILLYFGFFHPRKA